MDVLLWGSVLAGFGWWACRRERARRRRAQVPCACQPSHVRLAGVERRCVRCGRVRLTMLFAETFGGPEEPTCGPCVRDLLDVDYGEGEAIGGAA